MSVQTGSTISFLLTVYFLLPSLRCRFPPSRLNCFTSSKEFKIIILYATQFRIISICSPLDTHALIYQTSNNHIRIPNAHRAITAFDRACSRRLKAMVTRLQFAIRTRRSPRPAPAVDRPPLRHLGFHRLLRSLLALDRCILLAHRLQRNRYVFFVRLMYSLRITISNARFC